MDQIKLLAQSVSFQLEGPGITPDTINPTKTLDKIFTSFVGFISIVAIIWFTLQIIFAGYKYISSKGDKNKIEEAGRSITNALLGLAIAVLAIFLTAFVAKILGLGNILDIPAQFNKLIIQ